MVLKKKKKEVLEEVPEPEEMEEEVKEEPSEVDILKNQILVMSNWQMYLPEVVAQLKLNGQELKNINENIIKLGEIIEES